MKQPSPLLLVCALLVLLRAASAQVGCENKYPLQYTLMNATTLAGNPSTCQDGSLLSPPPPLHQH